MNNSRFLPPKRFKNTSNNFKILEPYPTNVNCHLTSGFKGFIPMCLLFSCFMQRKRSMDTLSFSYHFSVRLMHTLGCSLQVIRISRFDL